MAESSFDQAWLARVKAGDEETARELIREHYPLVIKIVRGHLPRRMDEEDLAQMIFVKVFQKIEQFQGQAPFTHWLSRIAVNTCLNELRGEKVRKELRWADLKEEEAEAMQRVLEQTTEATADEQAGTRELAGRLLESLGALDRAIVTLLDMEGRSVAEVAKLTGTNVGVVKIRAFRARRKLRKELENLERSRI